MPMSHSCPIFQRGASLFAVLLLAVHAPAQTSVHGALQGRVLDPQGLGVPAARVSATAIETGAQVAAEADDSGTYQFPRLVPGSYKVEVEKAGFRRGVLDAVPVALNETTTADLKLTVGEPTEIVTVSAEATIVQSQRVEIAGRVDERRVRELPLNGENFNRLVLLAPGVGGASANNPAVSGARPVANNYAVDGMTANDERGSSGLSLGGGGAAEFTGASPNLVSTEAIQEFSIITSNADATFGRGSGAQVNIITKSGTNEWHGSLYHYLRNNKLDARDFFNTGPFFDSRGRSVVPPFKQNLFGGSVGGPVRRNRHFVFGNYEGFRQRLEQTASATLPNAALISLIPGDLGRLFRLFYHDGGVVPTQGSPAGTFSALTAVERTAALNGGFPAELFDGNAANGEVGTVLASTANTRNIDQDSFLIRTDHRVSDRLSASARYSFAQPFASTNTQAIAGVIQENRRRWQSALAQLVYTASPTQIWELRAGLLRSRVTDAPRAPVAPNLVAFGVDRQLGLNVFAAGTVLSRIQIPGEVGFLDNQTVPQLSLMHTWSRGRLTLRSGLDVRWLDLNVLLISNATTFQFQGIVGPTGLIGSRFGQPQAISTELNTTLYGVNGGPTTPLRNWRSTEHEYFTQADVRLRRDLTLNLGLRYSLYGTYSPGGNFMGNLYAVDPATGQVVPDRSPFAFGRLSNVVAPVTDDRPLHQPDRNNWQPRTGLSWNVGGRDATVIRAAFGVYADRYFQRLFDFGVLNPPYAHSNIFTNLAFPERAQIPLNTSIPPQGRFIDPTLRNPNTYRTNVAVEQRITPNTSVTAAYVGLRARGLYRWAEPNGLGAVPQQFRPDPRYARYRSVDNAADSNYDALQLFARHRFSRGIDFTLAYTYGRSIDNYSTDVGDNSVRNPVSGLAQFPSLINLAGNPAAGFQGAQWVERPIDAERGYSDFDMRHSLVISHLVELPFGRGRRFGPNLPGIANVLLGGWTVAGLVTLRSGQPIYLSEGSDYGDVGIATSPRPALLRGTVADLYGNGQFGRTQFLLPKPQVDQYLGIPATVTDPFAVMRRNALRGPASQVYDLSLIKRFTLREGLNVGFEANAFNVLNRAVFANPIGTFRDARFGRVISTLPGSNPRQIQLALKLTF